MSWIDWTLVVAYLLFITWDGIRLSRRGEGVESYFLANRSLPWWAVGLSVMATQMSAITLVSATGQGYTDGTRFVQLYFGLPLAMIILSVTVVPFFYRARVYTAYEYLERRFDAKTRALASLLFLAQRGISAGIIVAAPSVILSIVLGWSRTATILAMGLTTTLYTMFGGVRAVTWTDVKQMVVIGIGLTTVIIVIVSGLPSDVGLGDAFSIAGAADRLNTLDFSFDLDETYTFWSGMIGGLFLMLSYFGCDQSQVQRYLTARSVDEGRWSLLMSAFAKIPLQFAILLIGLLVFVYYQFQQPPVVFEPRIAATAEATSPEYRRLGGEFAAAHAERRRAAEEMIRSNEEGDKVEAYRSANARVDSVRRSALAAAAVAGGRKEVRDVNYIFPSFITTRLPVGVVGLLIAAIFAAAMSSISSELNALSTATVIDFYRRHLRPEADDRHYLLVSKLSTGIWGLVACGVAIATSGEGSLIEVVNKYGSYFYGSLLGVFVLAIGVRRANGTGAFAGLIGGMLAVFLVANVGSFDISFLWYNVVGCVAAVAVGLAVSLVSDPPPRRAS